MILVSSMTKTQREAHARMLSSLPVRSYSDEPENWSESERMLSPDEAYFVPTLEEWLRGE